MRALWRRGPSLAADVEKVLNRRRPEPLAYTTVVNVLTNLETKGVVTHTVEGRAFRFVPVVTEPELLQRQARIRIRDLFGLFPDGAVAATVTEVRSDPALADRFRRLLDEERDDEGGGA